MENKYNFKFQTSDNSIIDCELILSFYSNKKNKNFLLFTDNTKDEDGNLVVYSYYEEESYLIPVTDEDELKIVNIVYDKTKSEIIGSGE